MTSELKINKIDYQKTEFGELPFEWEILKLGDVLDLLTDFTANGSFASLKENVKYYSEENYAILVRTKDLQKNMLGKDFVYTDKKGYDFLKKSYLLGEELIMNNVGAGAGQVFIMPPINKKATIGPNALVFKPNNQKSIAKYLYYYLKSDVGMNELSKLSPTGALKSINKTMLKQMIIPLPSLSEQKKIAEILSAADAQIEITEQLIQKTKELKKGLMRKLLTKGVRHTQFKSSDLGEIPIEWNVVQFNDICSRIIVGIASSTSQYYTTEKAVPILRNQNIKENKIRAKDVLYITKEFDEMNYKKRLRKGDILTVRTGYPGLTAVVPSEFEEAQSFTTLISSPNPVLANSHYLAYYMNSEIGKKDLTGLSAGGAQQNLNVRSLSTFKLKLPPLAEQAQIVDVLSSIDTQIEIYEKEKGKQIELKKALMQQLLTGKLRVTV